MKPRCKPCIESKIEPDFSAIFGEKLVEDILYRMFNPRSMNESDGDSGKKVDVNAMVKGYLKESQREKDFDLESRQLAALGWAQDDWRQKYYPGYGKLKDARAKAWEHLKDRVRKGEIKPGDLSPKQIIENFPEKIVEEFSREDFLDTGSMRLHRDFLYPDMFINLPEFTSKGENMIARRVLEEAFKNLDKKGTGAHETFKEGIGIHPSHKLQEYDEHSHSYDTLDIQETLISTALSDPEDLKIRNEDILVREPHHMAKTANAILLDSSFSMDGEKFVGAVMAALALRELLQSEFRDDSLYIIAYNHEVQKIAPGELTRLRPLGYTDIGLALDIAIKNLEKEEANRSIFLITDSEPTASSHPDLSPVQSALRAAKEAGNANIRLHLIMLDSREELKLLCEEIAVVNGRATVTFIEDPLNLKEFMIRSYMELRAAASA